jgi:hypothetical protein
VEKSGQLWIQSFAFWLASWILADFSGFLDSNSSAFSGFLAVSGLDGSLDDSVVTIRQIRWQWQQQVAIAK